MFVRRFREVLSRRHNVRAHFWQSCSNYTQQISGLILSVLLARLLAPEDFGEFAYAGAVLALFMLPVSWSLAPQVVAEVRSHPEIVNDALHYCRMLLAPRILLAATGCFFLIWTKGWQQGAVALVLSVPLVGADFVTILRAAMEGQGAFKANFFDSVFAACATVFISIPAAFFGAGVWSLVAPAVPLFAIQMVLYAHMSRHSIHPTAPITARSYLRSGTALWLCGCGESALLRSDKFLLGQFAGMAALGDYNRAFNFSPLAARALNSLLTNPTIAALTSAHNEYAQHRLLLKSGLLLFAAGAVNFFAWWFFADPLVPFLFGDQWRSAVPVFEAMAPLSLAMSIAYLPTTVAMAKRAYGRLAVARATTLLVFLGFVWQLSETIDATTMAWLLQLTLFAQGLLIAVLLCIKTNQDRARI
jgi:PST family polysaccharide transporter